MIGVLRGLWWVVLAGISIAAVGFWSCSESQNVHIHHSWIKDEAHSRRLDHAVMVQISDIHIGRFGPHLSTMLRRLDELKPNILLLTGDYVKWNGDYELALEFFSRLRAPAGVFAVMGDYDYSNSRKSCLFCHEPGTGRQTNRHGVKFLRDSCEQAGLGEDDVVICGLNGMQTEESVSHETVGYIRGMAKVRTVIVLSHSPLAFDLFSEDDDVLILAGDTHGGQIPLPS